MRKTNEKRENSNGEQRINVLQVIKTKNEKIIKYYTEQCREGLITEQEALEQLMRLPEDALLNILLFSEYMGQYNEQLFKVVFQNEPLDPEMDAAVTEAASRIIKDLPKAVDNLNDLYLPENCYDECEPVLIRQSRNAADDAEEEDQRNLLFEQENDKAIQKEESGLRYYLSFLREKDEDQEPQWDIRGMAVKRVKKKYEVQE